MKITITVDPAPPTITFQNGTIIVDQVAAEAKASAAPVPTWVGRTGEVHRLADMTSRYLENVRRMLERRCQTDLGIYAAVLRQLEDRCDD
jgi:hypothetical protein